MSDLKPGTLVLLDPEQWPSTTEISGLLWIFVGEEDLEGTVFRYECKSVATGVVHMFDRNSLTIAKEQPDE